MTNKLPAYFEKYFEQKFGDISSDFQELRTHVNDEIQLIRETIQKLERNQTKIIIAAAGIGIILALHDLLQGSVLGWILRFAGV